MRAVIYCRVSTEEEIQINALKSQVQEAIAAVHQNGWILIDQYVDEGRSGTTSKKRDEYNRLVSELDRDKYDIIVVKSQDRLMRNTREWYFFVDKLVQAKKKLFFYLENKFYTPDDALITGIKAILAEEYSRDLSKKINNAHKNRQEKGTNIVITSNTWGYDKVNKQVVINEKEAEIVRMIYNLCCEGYGSRTISKMLDEKGIKSRNGGKFPEQTVRKIIRNPLFMGTAVMNKSHKDFDTKETVRLDKSEWIIHEDMVPAIVSESVWKCANQMIDSRAVEEKVDDFVTRRRGQKKGNHFLSGKIVCGECGSIYWQSFRKNAQGEQVIDWYCREYLQRGRKTPSKRSKNVKVGIGGCDNIHIKSSDLEELLFRIGKKIFSEDGLEQMQSVLLSIIERAINSQEVDIDELKQNQKAIMKKRELLLDKLLDGILTDELFQSKDEILKEEYDNLQTEIDRVSKIREDGERSSQRIADIRNEIKDINDKVLVLSKLGEHITKITVFQDHGIVSLDIPEEVCFDIKRINYMKVEYHIRL